MRALDRQLDRQIVSDGGSSSYYDLEIPKWLLTTIIKRAGEGQAFIKVEEIIEMLGSDFDEGNILKCVVRLNGLRNGRGKQGNTPEYEANKIQYSANRIKERGSRDGLCK